MFSSPQRNALSPTHTSPTLPPNAPRLSLFLISGLLRTATASPSVLAMPPGGLLSPAPLTIARPSVRPSVRVVAGPACPRQIRLRLRLLSSFTFHVSRPPHASQSHATQCCYIHTYTQTPHIHPYTTLYRLIPKAVCSNSRFPSPESKSVSRRPVERSRSLPVSQSRPFYVVLRVVSHVNVVNAMLHERVDVDVVLPDGGAWQCAKLCRACKWAQNLPDRSLSSVRRGLCFYFG